MGRKWWRQRRAVTSLLRQGGRRGCTTSSQTSTRSSVSLSWASQAQSPSYSLPLYCIRARQPVFKLYCCVTLGMALNLLWFSLFKQKMEQEALQSIKLRHRKHLEQCQYIIDRLYVQLGLILVMKCHFKMAHCQLTLGQK